ncbi:MAG: CSLREA domain-containing protein [Solirubrobacterales bacterium]|nr:CSLREA domain-containing protein [Solirubrobacterales bacterium]HMT04838.1 CSLREA domain-containing protein [Solirubrobacterales bacterium]
MKSFFAGLCLAAAMLVLPAAANAVTITVNTTSDVYGDGASTCSLREAITSAQTNAAFDGCAAGFAEDTIQLPAGDYAITRAGADEDANLTGDFDITGANALNIEPNSPEAKVSIDGNDIDRIFDKTSVGDLGLKSIRITGGKLTLIEDGGGVRAGVGTTTMESVTIDSNTVVQQGGGIAVYSALQMINSTVSGNKANGNGGGIYIPGGGTATIRSSTIVSNQADADNSGAGYGGGFADTGATSVNFTNVLNAGNSGKPAVPANQASDCFSGPFFFPRFVLQTQPIGPSECLAGFGVSNVVVADAMFGPLQFNGGQTPTHNLLAGSPAIGKGGLNAPDQCPAIDQNGVARAAGSCDIGSTTYVEPTPPVVDPDVPDPAKVPKLGITKVQPKKKVVKRKKVKTVTVVVTNSGEGTATAGRICLVLPKASKKGLKAKGKLCRNVGDIAAGATVKAKIKLKAKPKAKKRAYTVKATVSATDVTTVNRKFKLKVK